MFSTPVFNPDGSTEKPAPPHKSLLIPGPGKRPTFDEVAKLVFVNTLRFRP